MTPRHAIGGLAVMVIMLFAHVGALNNGFHYDDMHSVVDNPHLRSLANPTAFFTDTSTFSARPERAMFRPLVVLSYAVTYAFAGLAPWAHLVVNCLAHFVVTIAVYGVASTLGLPWAAAAGASLLFAVHPVNSEVANYVSSRSESFAAAGMLFSLWAYLRWRISGGVYLYVIALAAFGLALISKATAIALPAMLVVAEVWLPGRRRLSRVVLQLAPFVAFGGFYFVVVARLVARSLGEPVRPVLQQIWTQLKAVPYYAHLLVVPTRLSVEHDFAVAQTPATPVVLLSLMLLLSAILIGLRWARARGRLLGSWSLLAVVPASIVPLHVLVNEHRLYLASVCAAIAVSVTVWPLLRRIRGLHLAGVLLVLILALLSRQRSTVWDSDWSLWSDAVHKAPHAYRAHMHLGGSLEAKGDVVGSLGSYTQAAQLRPDVPEVHYNLGNALRLSGRVTEAQQSWERALEQDPEHLEALLNLAASHQDAGDLTQTATLLRRAEAAHPQSPEVWRRQGMVLHLTGNGAGARAAFLHSLDLDSAWVKTHFSLANHYFSGGRMGDAAQHYEAALQYRPSHPGAAYNLADLHLRTGDPVAAEGVCRRALRHTSAQSKLYFLLGLALEARGQTADALTNYRVFLRSGAARGSVLEDVRQHIERLESAIDRDP